MKRLLASFVAMLCLAATPGCNQRNQQPTSLSVFAASSLTEAFADLEAAFERANPEVDVRLTLAGSQVLRLQIEHGAPADVFASANEAHMESLREQGLVAASRRFAHNELVVIVPTDNPAAIKSFSDLPRARRLVIGADNVPVGRYTRQVFDRAREHFGEAFVARARDSVVSEESNVRLARAKVELGEADAAIVYRTDAAASAAVRVVSIPAALNVRAHYTIAPVLRAAAPVLARRFVTFVRSSAGQAILMRHGFAPGAA